MDAQGEHSENQPRDGSVIVYKVEKGKDGEEEGDDDEEDGLVMEKLKTRGPLPPSHDLPANSQCFWMLEEEEDVESAPRDMKLKWKRLLQQKRAGPCSSADSDEDHDANTVGENGYSRWSDLPMELLVRIMALVDNRTVIVGSGVCHSWREALRQGILDLSFSWCGRNVSKLVQSLAPKFSRLSTCNLCRCRFLRDSAVEALGGHMHELKNLDLTNGTALTDVSLTALAKGCVRLEKLNLSGCTGVTEAGLVSLAENCTSLKQLDLCGCDSAATDDALRALARNCSGLQYLNVGWCERVTDLGVTALAQGCSELRVVDLCGCHFITDRSVMVLADCCLRLRVLNLYSCQNVTDLSMYALADKGNAYNGAGRSRGTVRQGVNNSSGRVYGNRRSATARAGSYSGSRSSSCSSGDSVTNHQSTTRGHIETLMSDLDGDGLVSLNLGGCRGLSAVAVQAVCNAYPALHTCPERHSLNISGCLNLTSVHCTCAMEARRERLSRDSQYRNSQAPPLHARNLPL